MGSGSALHLGVFKRERGGETAFQREVDADVLVSSSVRDPKPDPLGLPVSPTMGHFAITWIISAMFILNITHLMKFMSTL